MATIHKLNQCFQKFLGIYPLQCEFIECTKDITYKIVCGKWMHFYTPRNKVRGVYWIHPVCPSVCLSVCLSVCPLTFRVRPVASTVQDGFFPYLVQMINNIRGCVACDDLWPWPISSRSFGLDLENRVRSVASTVLAGFFLFLAQIIAIIRECVACYVLFKIWRIKFLANFKKISALTLTKKSIVRDGFFPCLAQMITGMRGCVAYNDLWPWPIPSRSTIGHLFYATSSFVHYFVATGEFKLELQSGNAQSGSNSTIFRAVWPWNVTDDLETQ